MENTIPEWRIECRIVGLFFTASKKFLFVLAFSVTRCSSLRLSVSFCQFSFLWPAYRESILGFGWEEYERSWTANRQSGLGNKTPWLWILGAGSKISQEFVQWRKWVERTELWSVEKSKGMRWKRGSLEEILAFKCLCRYSPNVWPVTKPANRILLAVRNLDVLWWVYAPGARDSKALTTLLLSTWLSSGIMFLLPLTLLSFPQHMGFSSHVILFSLPVPNWLIIFSFSYSNSGAQPPVLLDRILHTSLVTGQPVESCSWPRHEVICLSWFKGQHSLFSQRGPEGGAVSLLMEGRAWQSPWLSRGLPRLADSVFWTFPPSILFPGFTSVSPLFELDCQGCLPVFILFYSSHCRHDDLSKTTHVISLF